MLFYLNSKMGDNSDKKKKKIRVTYFFIRNPYMKFQNISIPGSKVMLCTRKRDERKNEQMHEQTSQKQYAPPTFFIVGGIVKTFPPSNLTCYKDSRPCPTVSQHQLVAPVTQGTHDTFAPPPDFRDGRRGSHPGFRIRTILVIFDLRVTPMLPAVSSQLAFRFRRRSEK